MRVLWHPRALRVFYRLPIHSATLLDRAVIAFAETGEGELFWDPPEYILRAGLHNAALAIDEQIRAIFVLRIFRAR